MRPIVVTRPGAAGRRLAARLEQLQREVAWWPAFEILPVADATAARACLQGLDRYDLALFVSVHAVDATRDLLPGPWPASTAIAVVGASTRAAAAALRGVDADRIIAPAADDESGSEGLWRAWQDGGYSARRVLVLRAEQGRDWLIEQFTAIGAQVEALTVYQRQPRGLAVEELARLRQWMAAQAQPVTVVSSSEAVATLDQMLPSVQAQQWLRTGTALATHARIAAQLQRAGFTRVITVAADDDEMVATLESLAA